MRKTHVLADGTEIVYGPVSVRQMLVRGEIPPQMVTEAAEASAEGTAETKIASGAFAGLYDALIAQGVVSPPVFFGPRGQTPAGSIHVMDLGDDYLTIANDILAISGVTQEAASAARFPDGEGAGGDGAGPGSPVGANA